MMMAEQAITLLHLSVSLAFLWVLLWCWRDYRVDALREKLFRLRNELFDYAADENIPFNDRAYIILRVTMNGMIRFSHKITFTRIFITMLARRVSSDLLIGPHKEWKEAVEALESAEVKKELIDMHNRMAVLVVRHLVFGSPIFLAGFAVSAVWWEISGAAKRIWEVIAVRLASTLDALEAQALEDQDRELGTRYLRRAVVR